MTTWLYGIARRCADHYKLVIVLWLIALFVVSGANKVLSPGQPEMYVLKGTNSATAQNLVRQAFPGSASDANPVAIYNANLDFRSGAGESERVFSTTQLRMRHKNSVRKLFFFAVNWT